MHYYEIEHKGGGVISFDTLEEAIQYADESGAQLICEIGGAWDEFGKCWFCEEWKTTDELNKDNLCDHCESYLISRGEI